MKKTLVGRVRVSKWGRSMPIGLLQRTRILVGRVRASKWGWEVAMGPLKR